MIPPRHIQKRYPIVDAYSFLFLSFGGRLEYGTCSLDADGPVATGRHPPKGKYKSYSTFFSCIPESQSSCFSFGFYSLSVGE
jgi:hypothetical protein